MRAITLGTLSCLAWLLALATGCSSSGSQAGPSSPEQGKTVHVHIIEDQDDPGVWETVRSFEAAPTPASTASAFAILDEMLTHWDSHPPGIATSIFDAIDKHRIEAGRPYLIRFLHIDPTLRYAPHVIRNAASALGSLGGKDALEELGRLAARGSQEVLPSVASALGNVGDPRAVAILETLLTQADPQLKQRALSALAKYCSATSRPFAIKYLTDPDDRVRNSATWWVSTCGGAEDASRLESQLDDTDELVRSNALKGLARVKSKAGCRKLPQLLADRSLTVQAIARDYEVVCKTP
jgi:HEAT repeat protein